MVISLLRFRALSPGPVPPLEPGSSFFKVAVPLQESFLTLDAL